MKLKIVEVAKSSGPWITELNVQDSADMAGAVQRIRSAVERVSQQRREHWNDRQVLRYEWTLYNQAGWAALFGTLDLMDGEATHSIPAMFVLGHSVPVPDVSDFLMLPRDKFERRLDERRAAEHIASPSV